jgi:S1-C subfamily serine protease
VYEASVVGFDEDKDVAVLHIDAPWDLLVGQKVFAIGNPVYLISFLINSVIEGTRKCSFVLNETGGSVLWALHSFGGRCGRKHKNNESIIKVNSEIKY